MFYINELYKWLDIKLFSVFQCLYSKRYVKVEDLCMKDILYEDMDVIKINEEMHAVASQLLSKKPMRLNIEVLCCDEMELLYKETYDILNHDEIAYDEIIQND